jgi:hypothetical protein
MGVRISKNLVVGIDYATEGVARMERERKPFDAQDDET